MVCKLTVVVYSKLLTNMLYVRCHNCMSMSPPCMGPWTYSYDIWPLCVCIHACVHAKQTVVGSTIHYSHTCNLFIPWTMNTSPSPSPHTKHCSLHSQERDWQWHTEPGEETTSDNGHDHIQEEKVCVLLFYHPDLHKKKSFDRGWLF